MTAWTKRTALLSIIAGTFVMTSGPGQVTADDVTNTIQDCTTVASRITMGWIPTLTYAVGNSGVSQWTGDGKIEAASWVYLGDTGLDGYDYLLSGMTEQYECASLECESNGETDADAMRNWAYDAYDAILTARSDEIDIPPICPSVD